MPQSAHDRIAELHNLAGHTHFAAAVAHRRKDYLGAQELSQKAHAYSEEAHRHSTELAENGGRPTTARTLPR